MLRQPDALYQYTKMETNGSLSQFWAPVPQNLWGYFGNVPEGAFIRERLAASGIDDEPTVIDGLNVALFIPVQYLSETERMWLVYGETLKPDGTTRCYEEWLGGLADRRVKPLPGEGGDQLAAYALTGTPWVELEWVGMPDVQAAGITNPIRTRSIPADSPLRKRPLETR